MTLQQFNGLEETLQARTLWNRGVHIGTREDEVYQYMLYQIDAFYVEVWYHVELEVVHRFRSFADTEALEPYLDQIDIYMLLT